jgi:hypothetical protein
MVLSVAGDTLHGIRASDGTSLWSQDLSGNGWFGGNFAGLYASPVLAGGRLYLLDRAGVTVVAEYDEVGARVLSVNRLVDPASAEQFWASMAVSPGRFFIRGSANLYGIGY